MIDPCLQQTAEGRLDRGCSDPRRVVCIPTWPESQQGPDETVEQPGCPEAVLKSKECQVAGKCFMLEALPSIEGRKLARQCLSFGLRGGGGRLKRPGDRGAKAQVRRG